MFFAILLMTDGLQGHSEWINSLWILSSEAITLIFILTIVNCRTYYATPPVPHFASSTSSLFLPESKMTLSGGLVLIFNSVKEAVMKANSRHCLAFYFNSTVMGRLANSLPHRALNACWQMLN